jgi:hypothetical protein
MLQNYFNFDSHCVIIENNLINLNEFIVVVRTKIELKNSSYSIACDEWLQLFSLATATNWIVKSTFPNKTNYLYRKDYVCQHSSKNKNKNISSDKTRIRNKQCSASIKIVIKKSTEHTRRRDKYLNNGLNTEIKVTYIPTYSNYTYIINFDYLPM